MTPHGINGVITAETAYRIWQAHHEVAQAEKLLADMRDQARRSAEVSPREALMDRRRSYELGVPHGDSGKRLYGVSPRLAQVVVEAHIAEMRHQIAEASAVARFELDSMPDRLAQAEGGA